jgi:hypothetical protein
VVGWWLCAVVLRFLRSRCFRLVCCGFCVRVLLGGSCWFLLRGAPSGVGWFCGVCASRGCSVFASFLCCGGVVFGALLVPARLAPRFPFLWGCLWVLLLLLSRVLVRCRWALRRSWLQWRLGLSRLVLRWLWGVALASMLSFCLLSLRLLFSASPPLHLPALDLARCLPLRLFALFPSAAARFLGSRVVCFPPLCLCVWRLALARSSRRRLCVLSCSLLRPLRAALCLRLAPLCVVVCPCLLSLAAFLLRSCLCWALVRGWRFLWVFSLAAFLGSHISQRFFSAFL